MVECAVWFKSQASYDYSRSGWGDALGNVVGGIPIPKNSCLGAHPPAPIRAHELLTQASNSMATPVTPLPSSLSDFQECVLWPRKTEKPREVGAHK